MQMEVYHSKMTNIALVTSEDGIILAKADDEGKPGAPEMIYNDTLENVMHEYARIGVTDWQHVDTIEVNQKPKQ